MKTPLHRLSFYRADLQLITGKSERTCQRIIQIIRDVYELKPWQQLTIYHASEYLGIPIDQLSPFMKGSSG